MQKVFWGFIFVLALTIMATDFNTSVYSQERDNAAPSSAYQSVKVEDWGINRLIKEGLTREVKDQIAQGFNVNGKDDFGWTPLMYACLWEKIEVVQLLLENGADVTAQGHQGASPLVIAVNFGDVPLMDLLLDTGVPINSKIECKKKDQAFQLNYTSKLILNHGAPSLIDNCGDTILIFAANYCRAKSVSALLARGADVDGQNEEGMTPLMKAGCDFMDADCGAAISDLLLTYGANINATDKKGYTALMYAVSGKNKAKVERLLNGEADASVTAKDGSTALSLARKTGSEEIANLISTAIEAKKERRK